MNDHHPTCLVTGATSGIGREAALALARRGWNVCLLSRHPDRGRTLVNRLRSRHPGQRFEFVACDLASFQSVRIAAESAVSAFPTIDSLVANAGSRIDRHHLSPDGLELTFATNHLGHFLLTALVWPAVAAAPTPRVITVTSGAHRAARPERGWIFTKDGYDRRLAYAGSKLANLLFARELARRIAGSPVVSVAYDPGVVATRFALNNGIWPWLKHVASHGLRGQLTTARTAGGHLADLTETASSEINGRLLRGAKIIEPSEAAKNPQLAFDLWQSSLHWCGLDKAHDPRLASPFSS